ncbi:MAG: response regulator [Myxococcaceae bacterium]|nr:MAG: response regulator [Myxococcaceae bacterium]
MSALKVLIFEYDRPFADALERAFARRGCSVRVVDDGQVGLDVALDDRPGLIILAIELPRMNGFAVCNRIKKHPDLKDIPLVIVSSDSPPETFEQHSKLRTRAEDYAHKPIDPEALIARAAAFVDIPSARDSEIVVDEEAIEEAIEEAPINLDDDMGGLSDAAFDNIVLESNPPRPMPGSAASLLEPLPEPRSGRPASQQVTSDDFEDYTMVSSAAELPLNFNDIARAVQANPLPPVPTPPAAVAPPLPPPPAVVVPPLARGSAPSLPRVGVAPPVPPPSLPSFVPPPAVEPSAPPQPSAAQLEAERLQRRVDELERDLATAQAATQRVVELTEDNQRLRAHGDELARVTRELEEKVRTSTLPLPGAISPSRPGGVSTREFLELRESLNRKDKDILARDREIIELRDKLLQAEMSTADIDDRLAERDQEVLSARQAGDAARAELQAEAARRAELERALSEAQQATTRGEASLREQLAATETQRARESEEHQRAIASLRAELEAATAASSSQASQLAALVAAEAALREEHAQALEAARAETRALAQQGEASLRAELEGALESARAEHAAALSAQRAELEGALEAARTEHSAALSSLRSEHAQVVDSLRSDYTTAVDAVKAESARALEAKVAEHAAEVEALRSDYTAAVDAVRAESARALEAKVAEHAAEVEALRSEQSSGLEVAAAATAAAVAAESSTRRELNDRIGSLESELSTLRSQGAALSSDVDAARARAEESAREVASLRDRLAAAERRHAAAGALLDRARQAMEIAAGLVHAAAEEQPSEGADTSAA